MNRVRWGLLSTANINRRLIPAIRESKRGDLVAVASRDQQRATAYAREWDIPMAFGGYASLLASDAVDAVYISLPNHLHATWTVRALQAGKHVLCEKPFALTLPDVDAMVAAAQRNDRVLAEAFMYRHHPQTRLVGDLLRQGRLGPVRHLWAVFSFPVRHPENIRLQPESGGGSLWDVGVYPVSLAQYVFGGPPVEVWGQQQLSPEGVDLFFSGQLRYSDGQLAQISSSLNAPFQTQAEIVGPAGRLSLNRPFVGLDDRERQMIIYPTEGRPAEVESASLPLYLGEVQDMHAAILDGDPPYLTLAESRNHVRTVLALYESARHGRPVSL